MLRKASYKLWVTRREALSVHDEPHHTLMLVELEGEPIDYTPGVAGKFLSRRSVNFHDRLRGSGTVQGYAMTYFEHGSVYSRFEGQRDGDTKITKGKWQTYKGTGKLTTIKGEGTFTVKAGDRPGEFILDMEGEYDL